MPRIRLSLSLLALLLSACRGPHVCAGACEAGIVAAQSGGSPAAEEDVAEPEPRAESQGAKAQDAKTATTASDELTQAAALAAFDEAWQTIHDTHFDPTFHGVDWDALKAELRPRAGEARTRDELRGILTEMLGRLGQSHFAVFPSSALPEEDTGERDQSGGLGFEVRLRDGRLLVTSVEADGAAAAAGVKPGWCVTRIGRMEVAEMLARLGEAPDLGPRKVAFTLWAGAMARVHGRIGSHETVAFLDGEDQPRELELERRKRDVSAHEVGPTLPTFYLEFHTGQLERAGKRVGWLAFSNWFLPVMQPLNEALEGMHGCDGIVIDLRGNTGGAVAMTMGIAGHFFGEMKKLGVMMTRDSRMNILAIPHKVNAAGARIEPFGGPLAILVDETTGSASEAFAGGMQSLGRARVFGATTAGAVLPAVTTRLPNGDSLLHALGDFETSTGTRLEGVGVVPDVPVPLTRAELLGGRDPVLEAALDWITSSEH